MKICFKRIAENSLEKILIWRTDPEVSKYMYTDPQLTMDDQKRWYKEKVINGGDCKYWLVNVDNMNIGVVSLYNIDHVNKRCYWAYYIGESGFMGKGIGKLIELNIMKYVFDNMNINKLCCEVFTSNDKVIKIHEKYGSKVEGVLRKHIFKNGEFHDIVTMGVLNDEWKVIKDNINFDLAIIEEYQ